MKLIVHPKAPKPESMTLGFTPMVVWLTKTRELRIEPGDTVLEVATAVMSVWPVKMARAKLLVGFWFGLGEAQAAQQFGEDSLNFDSSSARAYSPTARKARTSSRR